MGDNWGSLFDTRISEYFGVVSKLDQAEDLIEEFAYATNTCYTVTRCNRTFGKFELNDEETHHIRFEDTVDPRRCDKRIPYKGVPFIIVGKKWMGCEQGPGRPNPPYTKKFDSDHSYEKAVRKRKPIGSKKIGCQACIMLREVISFPEYKLLIDTERGRKECSARVRADLNSTNYDNIIVQREIFIDLPMPSSHTNHIIGEAAHLKAPIDPQVFDHIMKLIQDGVTQLLIIKKKIRMFVKENFKGNAINTINRRFQPSRVDLRNIVYWHKKQKMKGFVDQEFMKEKIAEWSAENPDDLWFDGEYHENDCENLTAVSFENISGENHCKNLPIVQQSFEDITSGENYDFEEDNSQNTTNDQAKDSTGSDIREILQEIHNMTFLICDKNLNFIKEKLKTVQDDMVHLAAENVGLAIENQMTDLPKRRKYGKKPPIQRDEDIQPEIIEIEIVDIGTNATFLELR